MRASCTLLPSQQSAQRLRQAGCGLSLLTNQMLTAVKHVLLSLLPNTSMSAATCKRRHAISYALHYAIHMCAVQLHLCPFAVAHHRHWKATRSLVSPTLFTVKTALATEDQPSQRCVPFYSRPQVVNDVCQIQFRM